MRLNLNLTIHEKVVQGSKPAPKQRTRTKAGFKTRIFNTRNEISQSWYNETTMTAHTKTMTEGGKISWFWKNEKERNKTNRQVDGSEKWGGGFCWGGKEEFGGGAVVVKRSYDENDGGDGRRGKGVVLCSVRFPFL
jgi:hypothetical protein